MQISRFVRHIDYSERPNGDGYGTGLSKGRLGQAETDSNEDKGK